MSILSVHMRTREGYVLVTAVGIIMLMSMLVASVLMITQSSAVYEATEYRRAQTRLLAMSGIDIAQSWIGQRPPENEIDESNPTAVALQTYANILTFANQWRRVELTNDVDGIIAELDIYLTCEQGKISVRDWFDIKKRTVLQDPANKVQSLLTFMQERVPDMRGVDLMQGLTRAVEERPCILMADDLSELMRQPSLGVLSDRLYSYPERAGIDDLLTFSPGGCSILYLSPSVRSLLGIPAKTFTFEEMQFIVDTLQSMGQQANTVQAVWKQIFEPLYKVSFDALPEPVRAYLNASLAPYTYTVYVRARYEGATALLRAQFEKTPTFDNSNREYGIKKLQWLS